MTTGRLISQDEKLRQAISRVLTEVVIDRIAIENDIASGIYKPLNRNANLINLDKLFHRKAAGASVPPAET
jgi:hypothetical protein